MNRFEHSRRRRRRLRRSGQRGQAAVELLVALPVALLVLAAGWQVVAAGHAWWTVSESARVAARATYVASRGEPAQLAQKHVRQAADEAAERTLPASMRAGRKTLVSKSGGVTVSAPLPIVGPLAKAIGRKNAPRITARSRIGQ